MYLSCFFLFTNMLPYGCIGAKVLITTAYILFCKIKIRLFSHRYAGMPQQAAQRVDVHAVHETALCKIIAQTVRRNGVFQSRSSEIFFEVSLEIPHLYTSAAILDRKQIITVNVSVFVLKPAPQDALCAL